MLVMQKVHHEAEGEDPEPMKIFDFLWRNEVFVVFIILFFSISFVKPA